MKDFNAWSFYWLVIWFGLGFFGPEIFALVSGHPENTLSDQVWRLEGGFGPVWTWNILHLFFAAGFIWLAGHMIFHIWRG